MITVCHLREFISSNSLFNFNLQKAILLKHWQKDSCCYLERVFRNCERERVRVRKISQYDEWGGCKIGYQINHSEDDIFLLQKSPNEILKWRKKLEQMRSKMCKKNNRITVFHSISSATTMIDFMKQPKYKSSIECVIGEFDVTKRWPKCNIEHYYLLHKCHRFRSPSGKRSFHGRFEHT